MGLFDKFKKEYYINRLVTAFKIVYDCGDMAAIYCLREHYSVKELKELFALLKKSEEAGTLQSALRIARPFKEKQDDVDVINWKYGGK